MTRLLDALGAHVAEHGFRTLNTNLVAARAGVGVATLYAYFPDIYAMLEAYADRSLETWHEVWARAPAFLPADDWRNAYRRSFRNSLDYAKQDYAYVRLINAYALAPELDAALLKIRRAHVEASADIFEQTGVVLPREQLEAVATTVLDAGWAAILVLAREEDPVLLAEHERLAISYLANFLDRN